MVASFSDRAHIWSALVVFRAPIRLPSATSSPRMKRLIILLSAFLCAIVRLGAEATAPKENVASNPSTAEQSPRVRLSLNQGWHFQHDDPPGNTVSLIYDIRPDAKEESQEIVADAQPKAAEGQSAAPVETLKPWILPSANAFIKDPAARHPKPAKRWSGEVSYLRSDFDDSAWQRVDLPHDWAIAGPFTAAGGGGMGRLPSGGVGWYRKKLTIPASDTGKSLILEIDGAMSYATVWLNGHLVGGWPYGYASWQLDLTPFVAFGQENQLAIRLDNPPLSARWYPGGGIYRNVWLTKTNPVHVGQWGVRVTTPQVSPAAATVELEVTLENASAQTAAVAVESLIYTLDANGARTGEPVARIEQSTTSIAGGASVTVKGAATVSKPRLWGPPPSQTPHRYVAETIVRQNGKVIDRYETSFGIRSLRFDPNSGLWVNGERIPIRGVNQHHDLGALGVAFNVRAAERQLEILREMGCNAVRMSHNPPAPELLELMDRMGFLVIDEIFDSWQRKKTPLDFHLIFPDWHEPDLRAMIRRDRNHPSVVIWSVGNEVGEQYTGDEGAAVGRALCEIAHDEDPTRPTTTAMNYAKPAMPLPAVVDVIGLNYQGEGIRQEPEFEGTDRIRTPPQYDAFHERFPNKVVLSTETASAFSSRGVYLFPVDKGISAPVRDGRGGDSKIHQVSAYELHAVDFGSSADKVFASLEKHPFVAGEFVWTGWDYLGEPTPYYTSRSSYSGIIDLAGFKKDRFYLYQARWRPDFPMAHLLPHWTWPERVGQVTPVHVFTSGDEAELFLNGKSLGRKKKGPFEHRLRWDDVVYEPGTLHVVAYKNGNLWAKDQVRTAGAAAGLKAEPDGATIRNDGRDLSFITVSVVDDDGLTVPRADNSIQFVVEGPGEIVATDNGDPTSFEPFPSHTRKAFSGLCLVIVRAKPGAEGTIKVTASADGLKAGTTSVTLER